MLFHHIFVMIFHTVFATDIIDSVDSTGIHQMNYITFNQNRPEIETFLLQSVVISNTSNPDWICDLNIAQKIALCERVFKQSKLNIQLNRIASYMAPFRCEQKYLRLINGSDIRRKMYVCYGRHDPVQTSFIEDTYYQRFYLSAGTTRDSIFLCKREFNEYSEWYVIYAYLQNVHITTLPERQMSTIEVTTELETNVDIAINSNPKELEFILVREIEYYKTDWVCDLPKEKKISLCQIIFAHEYYRVQRVIKVNKSAFYVFEADCAQKSIKLRYSKINKQIQFDTYMYPCFSENRYHFLNSNPLFYKYLKLFYVSSGPRRNSVLVYVATGQQPDEGKYNLFQMYENIRINDLKPTVIDSQEVTEMVIKHKENLELLVQTRVNLETIKFELESAKTIKDYLAVHRTGINKFQNKSIDNLQTFSEYDEMMKMYINHLDKQRDSNIKKIYFTFESGDQVINVRDLMLELEKTNSLASKTLEQYQKIDVKQLFIEWLQEYENLKALSRSEQVEIQNTKTTKRKKIKKKKK